MHELLLCDWLQEKRLSGVSNQSHDSQASNSTASAASHEERQGLSRPREAALDGRGHEQEDEELDEMEVEYIEVSGPNATSSRTQEAPVHAGERG